MVCSMAFQLRLHANMWRYLQFRKRGCPTFMSAAKCVSYADVVVTTSDWISCFSLVADMVDRAIIRRRVFIDTEPLTWGVFITQVCLCIQWCYLSSCLLWLTNYSSDQSVWMPLTSDSLVRFLLNRSNSIYSFVICDCACHPRWNYKTILWLDLWLSTVIILFRTVSAIDSKMLCTRTQLKVYMYIRNKENHLLKV
jgi:hypothetical protein